MRELKFRAWDEQQKVMHHDFQYIKSGDEGNDWIVFTSHKHKLTDLAQLLENPYFSQQLKVMQWTGINDIYEGDIVDFNCLGVVKYDEDRFFVDYGNLHTRIGKHHKVVGNIYENEKLFCRDCKYDKADTYHDKMLCRDCRNKDRYQNNRTDEMRASELRIGNYLDTKQAID